MAEPKPRNYESEYIDAFTKEIPFPMLKIETCLLNPADPSIAYTLTKAGIRDKFKFELYVQPLTLKKLMAAKKDLEAEKNAFEDKKIEEEKTLKSTADRKLYKLSIQILIFCFNTSEFLSLYYFYQN